MEKADCFHLGYVAKLHGFKGEVSLFLDVTNPEDYETLDAVFIEINGQLTPFFVTAFKLKNKGFAAVKFEGVTSENDARILLRKNLFLPAQILPKLSGNNFYDHEVVGYKVMDSLFGEVGILESIIDLQVNPLIQIMNGSKEVLVPLIEGLVQKVDRANKTLHITAPAGLIELYLQ
ncbi:MAG: 16S rRNA processing protein RimM [Crocinitomicaceae bacterium]|jgi:16S rRNA processing protein RimM|nr:16S rRNA processing protein RimM [Crocinitomicaceae bacterium]